MPRPLLLWLLLLPGLFLVPAHPSRAETPAEFFRDRVEPVLRDHCFACHSHASGKMKGGLTLDSRSGWESGGGRGPALIPGDPDQSLLIKAIRRGEAGLRMPPDDPLDPEEAEILVRWVHDGAFDPRTSPPKESPAISTDWWSLRPLVRLAVPHASRAANPVDAFLSEGQRTAGLIGSSPADRRTLIRRLSLDLHGLPPTFDEVAAFVSDDRADAYEQLVERLLASPRYGQRWARHWFDTIHFADSHGFEHDVFRPNAWRFRDYVIQRFNDDVPWHTFVREQLAADVLYPEAQHEWAALGFLGAGTYDHSAAATAPMSFEHLDRDDLVNQVAASFVSSTAQCARCHDHKFDPIPQADYYALQAVFAGIGKGNIPFEPDPEVAARRRTWEQWKHAANPPQPDRLQSVEAVRMVEHWEAGLPSLPQWPPLLPEVFLSAGGAQLQRLPDGSVLSGGTAPEKETLTIITSAPLAKITALRLDVLTDDSLPQRGPGRAMNGNLHLTEFQMQLFRAGEPEPRRLVIARAVADFDQAGWTIQHALDGNPATGWGVNPQEGRNHSAIFELAEPCVLTPQDRLVLSLHQDHGRQHVIGRLSLAVTDGPAGDAVVIPASIAAILAVPANSRTPEQSLALAAWVIQRKAEDELRRLPAPQQLYAAAPVAQNERGTITIATPREIRMLKRGNLEQPGEVIGPGTLSAVTVLPARFSVDSSQPESQRRAALAEWIAHRENPLTWRSIANRVWQYHFGTGLCDTPIDFGRMGGPPSHPELLDWLACEVRDGGGSLKHLHRLICLSDTYRQVSTSRPELVAADPANRLLARMTSQRLDADAYRDAVLLASGRLNNQQEGPAVAHFSSRPGAQLTPYLDYGDFDWNGPQATRRSIYRVVWRGIPDPVFDALDFPDLGLLAPTRGFSASPLQALTLLNNRFVLHHAAHLAKRVQAEAGELPIQIGAAVRHTWQRDPTPDELVQLQALAAGHGLQAVCRLLLASNEFLFVE
ncbi:MAG: PSD1 and planctomycete cytochrome C domain-containing protein [Planctomycetaceae bacterium]